MSKTTRLLVLGVVRIFQPVHGYDVRRELASWHAEEWASVAPGSIYNQLKSLTKEEFLEVVDTNQVGGRPERTRYRLTPRGEIEFADLLRDAWWNVRAPIDPLAAGVALISFMQRAEAISALEARIAQVEGHIAHAKYAIESIRDDDAETPAHVRELIGLLNARQGSEIEWARALIPRLKAGQYRLADDGPYDTSRGKRIGPMSADAPAPAKRAPRRRKTTPRRPPRTPRQRR